ncbi:MAG: enoyl-CoA hydratase/isomerase family protein [Bacteriovoracaceae bacterium]|nr:enoyl-CoA hydratase/isomerase family protein [Bacteriovoracaceae bacterium]
MSALFNYKTLVTRLEKSTRTLYVTINDIENQNDFSMEMLFEFESILSWLITKVEIHSVVVNSSTEYFSRGLNNQHIKHLKRPTLEKLLEKVAKLNLAMLHLPQTIVFDLGNGAQGVAAELALGADIRLANINTQIKFNHTHFGLIACSGGLGLLSHIINPAMARNWVLSAANIPSQQLTESGFIYQMYDSTNRDEVLKKLLESIRTQAPIQRIQSKLGLLEVIREKVEASIEFEKKLTKAAMMAEDWKNIDENHNREFLKAKSMSYSVKLTLLKNEEHAEALPNNVTPIN